MKRLIFWTLIVIAAVLTIALLFELRQWRQARSDNELLNQMRQGHDITAEQLVGARPEIRLARAIYLRRGHRYDDALASLNPILDEGGDAFRAQVRYNLGNLYLSQALERVQIDEIEQALALAELAKDAYRSALRIDSAYWDAKYNLEVAMRLAPEMERVQSEADENDNRKSAPLTTLPGFPRGLP